MNRSKIYNLSSSSLHFLSSRKSGSKWWLKNIRVATIAINALDDPFIEETSLPSSHDLLVSDEDDSPLAPVRLYYTNYGGEYTEIFPFFFKYLYDISKFKVIVGLFPPCWVRTYRLMVGWPKSCRALSYIYLKIYSYRFLRFLSS